MKRNHVIALATPLLVLLSALSAAAQEKPLTTNKDMENTVKVTVSGETDMNYVWRRREVVAFMGGASTTSDPSNASSEDTFEGFIALRVSVDLSDKISAVLEIGSKRANGGVLSIFSGTQGGTNPAAMNLQLREASVTLGELFMPELRVQLGIATWTFDIRGNGQSFAYDPRHSQRFNRNLSPAADGATALGLRAHDPEEFTPMGIWVRYGRESLAFDILALPGVIEGGALTADEAFYAMDLIYKLDGKGSQIGLIVSMTSDPGGFTTTLTFGGGFDYRGMENLEFYGEIYFNRGQVAAGVTADGYAYQVGAVFTTGGELKPWFALNFTYYSGDPDPVANNRASGFSAYENIHDLLILEDMFLGYDWDSNYRAIKVSGGLALNAGALNNLKLGVMAGFAQTAHAVQFGGLGTTHRLGTEIDGRAQWEVTRQVSVNFGIGLLYGSKVLQNSMAAFPGGIGAKMETILLTFGTDLRF